MNEGMEKRAEKIFDQWFKTVQHNPNFKGISRPVMKEIFMAGFSQYHEMNEADMRGWTETLYPSKKEH